MSRTPERLAATWRRAGETGPPVDLYETDDHVVIRLAIPGGDAGALTLTMGDESVRVRGETPPPSAWSERTVVHWQEIPYGRFDRSIPLPCAVESKARALASSTASSRSRCRSSGPSRRVPYRSRSRAPDAHRAGHFGVQMVHHP